MEVKVSVIIPTYNRADTIERCIKSVTAQTLSDIEIIVVDDGSTDATSSRLHAIRDDRITLIRQENTGQGFARNRGIDASCGKYIAFVDSDDTIEPEMLRAMYDRAEKDRADVVQCGITDIYPDGRRVSQLKYADETVTVTDKGAYMDKYFTPCRHSYEVCNKLIRRDLTVTSAVRFRDTKRCFSEDLMFNMELIPHINKISFIEKPYYNYFQNENSHLHQNAEKRLTSICTLFRDFTDSARGSVKIAAAYTAAMIIAYNAGQCARVNKKAASDVLCGKEYISYVKTALTRRCKLKHRLFLTAMLLPSPKIKISLAERYGGRWDK